MKENLANEKEEKEENEENKKEEEKEEKKEEEDEENKIEEKINSVPDEMKCFLCNDFCEEPVQSLCCNEIFCKKHITREILKRFMCPKCKKKCGLNNIIENKKIADNIKWFKKFLNDLLEEKKF